MAASLRPEVNWGRKYAGPGRDRWLKTTAAQAEQAPARARAASSYLAAHAMTVPPEPVGSDLSRLVHPGWLGMTGGPSRLESRSLRMLPEMVG